MSPELAATGNDFATVLDRAIRDRKTTLSHLARQLEALGTPISVGALSYWRSGQRRPEGGTSLEVLNHLEDLLDLTPGELTERRGPSRRTTPDHCEHFDELIGLGGSLHSVLEAIGFDHTDDLITTGGAVTVDVGPDRKAQRTTNRIHWRARRDGTKRTPTYLQMDTPGSPIPAIKAVSGCTVGEGCYDPQTGIVAWELILERTLNRGETAITEVDLQIEENEDVLFYNCVAERRISEGVLWVRFAPDALPQQVVAFQDVEAGTTSETVPLIGTSVHHMVHNFGPGSFGLRWDW